MAKTIAGPINPLRIKTLLAFILCLTSCTPAILSWKCQETFASSPAYNSAILTLESDQDYNGIELEIVRGGNGIRMYVNFLSLPITALAKNNHKCSVLFTINHIEHDILCDLLLGGQRLLLPPAITNQLIEALLADQEIEIAIAMYHAKITSYQFAESYDKFLAVPIALAM